MGYDLHIVREQGEITPEEIESLAEFELQDGLSATNPQTGEEMTLGGAFAIWTDPTHPDGIPFMVGHGGLTVKYTDDTMPIALEVASRLGARVQGDEGEYYDEDRPPKRRRGFFRRS